MTGVLAKALADKKADKNSDGQRGDRLVVTAVPDSPASIVNEA